MIEAVQRKKGFTLIELLVVISIVAVLSTIGFIVYGNVQAQARNANRKSALRELQVALELYYNKYKVYPSTNNAWYSSEQGDNDSDNGGNYIPGLVPEYIRALPRDPRGGDSPICQGPPIRKQAYIYRSDGSDYALLAHCSQEVTTWTSTDPFYDSIRPTWAWKVCSGAGCTW